MAEQLAALQISPQQPLSQIHAARGKLARQNAGKIIKESSLSLCKRASFLMRRIMMPQSKFYEQRPGDANAF